MENCMHTKRNIVWELKRILTIDQNGVSYDERNRQSKQIAVHVGRVWLLLGEMNVGNELINKVNITPRKQLISVFSISESHLCLKINVLVILA